MNTVQVPGRWWEDPDIRDWQQGMCDTYAMALIRLFPYLRLGAITESYESDGDPCELERHWFAHDDQHAYDSLGRHNLPYLGIEPAPTYLCRLNISPGDYGWDWPHFFGENANEADYDRALSLIPVQHPWLLS